MCLQFFFFRLGPGGSPLCPPTIHANDECCWGTAHAKRLPLRLRSSRHLVLVPPWRRKPVPQKTRARLRDSHFLETKSRRQPDCCPLRFGRQMEIRSMSRVSSLRREGHLGVRDIEVDEKEAPIGAATVRER